MERLDGLTEEQWWEVAKWLPAVWLSRPFPQRENREGVAEEAARRAGLGSEHIPVLDALVEDICRLEPLYGEGDYAADKDPQPADHLSSCEKARLAAVWLAISMTYAEWPDSEDWEDDEIPETEWGAFFFERSTIINEVTGLAIIDDYAPMGVVDCLDHIWDEKGITGPYSPMDD